MTIAESLYFNYAGEYSYHKNIINIQYNVSGLIEEQFLPNKEIVETKIRGNDTPYFQEVQRDPLTINLSFTFENGFWTDELIRDAAIWLNQDYYKPLYFSDNQDRVFYAQYVDSPMLLHNCLKQGVIQISMRCDSPYTYSPVYLSPTFVSESEIAIINYGDLPIKPEVIIEKLGAEEEISIRNTSNAGLQMKFVDIEQGEGLYVNCENKFIESNIGDKYRYDNLVGDYLELLPGKNVLTIGGDLKIRFRWRAKLLT